MVDNNQKINIKKLKKQIENDWISFPKINSIDNDKGIIMLFLDNNNAFFILDLPKPIPWSDLEGPCATAYYWSKATKELKNHTGHYIVSYIGSDINYFILEQSIIITKIIISITELIKIKGIYWGSGTVVNSPEYLIKIGKECLEKDLLPVSLWIEYRIEKNKDDTHNILTTGMDTFGHREIEIQNTRKNPFDILFSLYHFTDYLLKNGPVVKDGDTIGVTKEDKNRVKFGPSLWNRDDVLIIEFI
ncbi:MAG: DUF4261 domain-containing protein [Candidatus Lokiarchaeota archaeon]|nr:DUF4261 domain-containing protein [Candidatus Lokiarchaeota archaeon]